MGADQTKEKQKSDDLPEKTTEAKQEEVAPEEPKEPLAPEEQKEPPVVTEEEKEPPKIEEKPPEPKKDPINCATCSSEITTDEYLRCHENPAQHSLCEACMKNYFSTILTEPETKIPPKCSMCSKPMEIPHVEHLLRRNVKEFELYLSYMVRKVKGEDEMVQSCPFCQYFEVWHKEHSEMLFYCKKQECQIVSCLLCMKELTRANKDTEVYEKELEEGIDYHRDTCYKYKDIKEQWDKVLEEGQNMYCPSCKLGGRKDENCTHISCESCGEYWCYFCGHGVSDLGVEDLYEEHNEGWQNDSSRCPMYMNEINEVDDRWSCEDQECLDMFHRKRTI